MADIALDLTWDIDPDGDIEFSVSHKGSENPLASFTLDEETIADALGEDLTLFDEGEPDSIFVDWENLAAGFEYYAHQITTLIEAAKRNKRR